MRHIMIVLTASTALAGCATSSSNVSKAEVAEQTATVATAAVGPVAPAEAPRPQIGSFGFDLAGMDRAVAPGDNFYHFANGTWARNTPIPADRSNYGMFAVLEELSTQRTREILEEQAQNPQSKIGNFYTSFMDRAAIDAAGITPLTPVLQSITAARTRADLAGVMGRLSRIGVGAPFGNFVDSDDKNPNSAILQFSQGGLGLPDRDYYLSRDAGLVAKRNAYKS